MEIWRYKLKNKYIVIEYIAEGKIYFKRNNQVFCLDTETGKEIWHFKHMDMAFYVYKGKLFIENHKIGTTSLRCLDIKTEREIWQRIFLPVMDLKIKNNKVYIYDGNFIYCIDIEGGEEIWKHSEKGFFQEGVKPGRNFQIDGFNLLDNRVFIIASYDIDNDHFKHICSLKADTGEEIGRFRTKTGRIFTGVDIRHVNNKKVIIVINKEVFTNDILYSLEASRNDILYYEEGTGKEIWRYTDQLITAPWLHEILTVDNEKVYFISNGFLYSLNLESGKEIWKLKIHSDSNLYMGDKKIYVISKSGVYCLDTEMGREIWKLSSNLYDYYMSVVDGRVYISTEDYIYSLDGETGREIWNFKLSSSSLLKVIDGRLYAESEKYLYCLDTEVNENVSN